MRRELAQRGVALAVLIAACGVTPAPTTTAPPPTSTAATSAVSCRLASIPSDAADFTTALDADYDGDGAPDGFSTYRKGGTWTLRLELSGNGGTETLIAGADPLTPAIPVGGFDIDEDGTPEGFVTVGSGAATILVGLFKVEECTLQRITMAGAPAVFPVGASVGNVSGLTCNGEGDIDRLFATSSDGVNYEGGNEPFQLSGSELVGGPGDAAAFTAEEAGELAHLDCGSLTLP